MEKALGFDRGLPSAIADYVFQPAYSLTGHFQEEFDYVMRDSYEGIDWFRNNQDPYDFVGAYVLLKAGVSETLYDRIGRSESIRIQAF